MVTEKFGFFQFTDPQNVLTKSLRSPQIIIKSKNKKLHQRGTKDVPNFDKNSVESQ